MIGDYVPPNFDVVNKDIGLEDVYLYYIEYLNNH